MGDAKYGEKVLDNRNQGFIKRISFNSSTYYI